MKKLFCVNPELTGSSRSRAALQEQVKPEQMRQVGWKNRIIKQEEQSMYRDSNQGSQWPQLPDKPIVIEGAHPWV